MAGKLSSVRRIIRFIDAKDKIARFGLLPDTMDPMETDISRKLVGHSVPVVELVQETQTRVYDYIQQGGDVDNKSTNHVTGCRSIKFTPTQEKAEVGLLLAPVPVDPVPSVWCIGLNYRKHWEEGAKKRGEPLPNIPSSFMKPPSSICGPGHPIWIPAPGVDGDRFSLSAGTNVNTHVDYEGELAIVIGKACRNIQEDEVLSGGYILGYTAGNDVSQRHWQRNSGGGQWGRGKSLDSYCPLGPCLLLSNNETGPNIDLAISTQVNNEIRQNSRTGDLIFGVAGVVSWLSRATTLVPGTVILTGTPSGVGYAREGGPFWLTSGDQVTVSIENIGSLTNPIVEEPIENDSRM